MLRLDSSIMIVGLLGLEHDFEPMVFICQKLVDMVLPASIDDPPDEYDASENQNQVKPKHGNIPPMIYFYCLIHQWFQYVRSRQVVTTVCKGVLVGNCVCTHLASRYLFLTILSITV